MSLCFITILEKINQSCMKVRKALFLLLVPNDSFCTQNECMFRIQLLTLHSKNCSDLPPVSSFYRPLFLVQIVITFEVKW